jgi:hypothetical protein
VKGWEGNPEGCKRCQALVRAWKLLGTDKPIYECPKSNTSP